MIHENNQVLPVTEFPTRQPKTVLPTKYDVIAEPGSSMAHSTYYSHCLHTS